jgi:hypothetical protein
MAVWKREEEDKALEDEEKAGFLGSRRRGGSVCRRIESLNG